MLDGHLSRSHEAPPVADRGGAGRGGPCGPRFCTRRSRGGFGLRAPTRRALRPASEQLRFGRSYVGDGPGSASWDSWATRTRKNAAVERREASTLRNWVRDASLGVQAVPVFGTVKVRRSAPSACRRSTPSFSRGRKRSVPGALRGPRALSRAGG